MKKVLAMVLSVVLLARLAIGGTVAFLRDMDGAVNVVTLGNVFVEQHEQQRVINDEGDYTGALVDFVQGQQMVPAVYSESKADTDVTVGEYGIKMRSRANVKGYMDKIVTVTNTGTTGAYVRTIIAVPEAGDFDTKASTNPGEQWFHWNGISDTDTTPTNGWYWGKNKAAGEWPTNADGWYYVDNVTIKVNGVDKKYDLIVATNVNIIDPKETTAPNLTGFYIDKRVDNERKSDGTTNYTFKTSDNTSYNLGDISDLKILVMPQAVQAEGFTDAWTALDDAFDTITVDSHPWKENGVNVAPASEAEKLQEALVNGEDVVLTKDISSTPSIEGQYSNKLGYVQKGGVFDGGNRTLSISDSDGGDNWGIETSGGTIKNVKIDGGVFRGVVLYTPDEDVIIDNLTIGPDAGVCYTINTAEHATKAGLKLIVSNSTLCGWTSFDGGLESASFTNTYFGEGSRFDEDNDWNRLVRPYINTTFTNCSFCEDFYLDLSALGSGCKVTFVNCNVNDTPITAENISDAFGTVKLPEGATDVGNYVIVANT